MDCLRIFISLDIDALGGDVIPGSPCSVRSSGDGSSCDTPPVHDSASSTEDGRTERGKYCDCCYCEFFGHAAVSNATVVRNAAPSTRFVKMVQLFRKKTLATEFHYKNLPATVLHFRCISCLRSKINAANTASVVTRERRVPSGE